MIEQVHDAGLKSEYAYIAGFASIGLSFAAWGTSRKAESAGTDRADAVGVGDFLPLGQCGVRAFKDFCAHAWVTT